jgi:hypothetical protein
VSKAGAFIGGALGLGLLSAAIYGAVHATQSASAAEKLSFDLDGVAVKEVLKKGGIVPIGVVYTFAIQVTNPSSKSLSISKLNIALSIKNKKGELSRIGNSVPTSDEKIFSGNSRSVLKHDIELRFANVLPVLPNFVSYVIDRLRGAKSSQQAIADISVDSMGITIPLTETIAL